MKLICTPLEVKCPYCGAQSIVGKFELTKLVKCSNMGNGGNNPVVENFFRFKFLSN
jgi:hypothetical protein